MRHLALRLVLGILLFTSGCAAGIMGPESSDGQLRLLTDTVTSAPRVVLEADPPSDSAEQQTDQQRTVISLTVGDEPPNSDESPSDLIPHRGQTSLNHSDDLASEPRSRGATAGLSSSAVPTEDTARQASSGPLSTSPADSTTTSDETVIDFDRQIPFVVQESQDAEEIVTPGPVPPSPFKPEADESQDRVSRQVTDVPIDIRPTAGEMPDDLAAAKFDGEPTINETWPGDAEPDVFCSYTPWTICYRPLYYEDIRLERYGNSVGYLQSGLSGVRFFAQIAAMPYKMTVRPPRSCQCSNGFSRPGDCPLPGYGHREFRLDASLVEAAAVTAVVYILP